MKIGKQILSLPPFFNLSHTGKIDIGYCMRTIVILLCLFLSLPHNLLYAQVEQDVFAVPSTLENNAKGKLMLHVDNLNFFQNNEFKTLTDGYSLPGLWIQPRLVLYPLENLKIEAGMHMLFYNGASHYPTRSYIKFLEYQNNDNKRVHIRPFFRAHLASKNQMFHLILGNLYGGSNHRLIEALYNPELNLTADPENGMQVLFKSKYLDADAWVDWQSFIFRNDNHRERFVLALSSLLRLNAPEKKLHWYIPLQIVGQHIGGEVQASPYHGVSSLANLGVGIGMKWNIGRKILKNLQAESHFVGYKQLTGTLLPIDNGYGWHNALSARLSNFSVQIGHMNSRKFVSILGSPYFGSLSDSAKPTVFRHSQMLYGKVEYSKRLKQIGSIGINLTLYQYFSGNGVNTDGDYVSNQSSTNVLTGIYLRVHPSLFLHQF